MCSISVMIPLSDCSISVENSHELQMTEVHSVKDQWTLYVVFLT